MTDRLRQALTVLEALPPDMRDDFARALLASARDDDCGEVEPEDIEPGHLAAVLDGLAQVERREFAVGDACEVVMAAFARARS
ncbi:hypothetical protein [Methylobacterium platani]|uniref:Uncharacterized protein n=1 Tax=Methylobacterium platani TaxID=427683 RepID=A0A179SCF3_9HYPH|nr:hypothetical protein [Methylobacterium platani]OAS24636.1 hypothetical protein A5481_12920 [Methylobacterium platani]